MVMMMSTANGLIYIVTLVLSVIFIYVYYYRVESTVDAIHFVFLYLTSFPAILGQ
jgi:hypothetical protein